MLVLLVGCSGGEPGTPEPSTADAPSAADAMGSSDDRGGALPEGAIRVGDDLHQVPIGVDAGGCPIYRLHSTRGAVVQAIFYRTASGAFTMDRKAAACPGPAGDDPAPPSGD